MQNVYRDASYSSLTSSWNDSLRALRKAYTFEGACRVRARRLIYKTCSGRDWQVSSQTAWGRSAPDQEAALACPYDLFSGYPTPVFL